MPTFHDLTTAQLKQAVQIREQIETLQAKLNSLLGGASATTPAKKLGGPAGRQKRTMSPAGRAKIAAAQKARWAKINGKAAAKTSPAKAVSVGSSVKAAPKKKGFSPETRAKLAAAMKARWAAKKAAK